MWYVRHEADGSISGPFEDRELALEKADMPFPLEGMIFSSDIFESDKVHEMLMAHLKSAIRDKDTSKVVHDLNAVRNNTSVFHRRLAELCEESAELILMLAGEPPEKLPADVSEMVENLVTSAAYAEEVAGFVELSVSDAVAIADRLRALARTREVTATVEGGVFDIDSMDDGVHLVVTDYDGFDDKPQEDDDGRSCSILEYGG